MNTPRSKSPTRFTVKPKNTPDGTYAPGINDQETSAVIGFFISLWPHVEEEMIPLFEVIAGIDNTENARLIFRTIIAQKSRIDIMRSLMEKSPHNVHLGGDYDNLIVEFTSLNKARNSYVHGRWFTHMESGDVYLEEDTATSGLIFLDARKITHGEIKQVFQRSMDLIASLRNPILYHPQP